MAGAHMGVLLRRRQTRMPEQFLNNPQIGTGIKEVCGKGMPKCMRADALQLSDLRRGMSHDITHAAHAQSVAAGIQKKRLLPLDWLSNLPMLLRQLFVSGQVGL